MVEPVSRREPLAFLQNAFLALVLFFFLVTTVNIPMAPQLRGIAKGFAMGLFDVLSTTKIVEKSRICILADLWDMPGITFEKDGKIYDCAQITEQFGDKAKEYRDVLPDEDKIKIRNETNFLKLFLWSYLLFALVYTYIISDFLRITGLFPTWSKANTLLFGLLQTIIFTALLLTMKLNSIFGILVSALRNSFVGGALGGLVILIAITGMIEFALHSIAYGMAKARAKAHDRFKALEMATRLEAEKGDMLMQYAR